MKEIGSETVFNFTYCGWVFFRKGTDLFLTIEDKKLSHSSDLFSSTICPTRKSARELLKKLPKKDQINYGITRIMADCLSGSR